MKKVWILEKWITPEERMKSIEEVRGLLRILKTEEERNRVSARIEEMLSELRENPEGVWNGWEGKTNYRQFCQVAKECLRRYEKKPDKFRVVSAQIEDGATQWLGYENPVENEGVLRYLYATK